MSRILRELKMQRPDKASEISMIRDKNNKRWVHILSSNYLGRNLIETKQEKAYNGKLYVV